MGLKEGEVIQHSMITKSIERAQKKVEENNFGIRKRLLEYDDVMNSQREVIYKKRKNALYGDRIQVDIANMKYDVCQNIIEQYASSGYEDFNFEVIRLLSVNNPISEADFLKLNTDDMVERLFEGVRAAYSRKMEALRKQTYPVIKEVFEHQAKAYENILIPITDGVKVYNIITNLEKNYNSNCEELIRSYEKSLTLATIDDNWKENLRELDDLKQSVQNATYEQKDPLLIYKFESFELFRSMVDRINKEVISVLMKGQLPLRDPSQVQRGEQPKRTDMSGLQTSKSEYGSSFDKASGESNEPRQQRVQPVRVDKKVGRNDPCPCGSGKKFKNCHGKLSADAAG
jgi:preprotein translocase subunit SecA